jgi:hypothetical protein
VQIPFNLFSISATERFAVTLRQLLCHFIEAGSLNTQQRGLTVALLERGCFQQRRRVEQSEETGQTGTSDFMRRTNKFCTDYSKLHNSAKTMTDYSRG